MRNQSCAESLCVIRDRELCHELWAEAHEHTALQGAALEHFGIDADVPLILLDRRAQDAAVFWEVVLRERGHDAAAAGACDVEPDLADQYRVANPGLLDEPMILRRDFD